MRPFTDGSVIKRSFVLSHDFSVMGDGHRYYKNKNHIQKSINT